MFPKGTEMASKFVERDDRFPPSLVAASGCGAHGSVVVAGYGELGGGMTPEPGDAPWFPASTDSNRRFDASRGGVPGSTGRARPWGHAVSPERLDGRASRATGEAMCGGEPDPPWLGSSPCAAGWASVCAGDWVFPSSTCCLRPGSGWGAYGDWDEWKAACCQNGDPSEERVPILEDLQK